MFLSVSVPIRLGLGFACCAPGYIAWGAAGAPIAGGWYVAMFLLAAALYWLGALILNQPARAL